MASYEINTGTASVWFAFWLAICLVGTSCSSDEISEPLSSSESGYLQGSAVKAPRSAPSALSVVPTKVPTPTPTRTPTVIPTPFPSPLMANATPGTTDRSTGRFSRPLPLVKSEVFREFTGQGSTITENFSPQSASKIVIRHKGGPISVGLTEDDPSPRDIYSGPATEGIQYSSGIIDPGTYSLVITCTHNCDWTIAIELVEATTSSRTPVPSSVKTIPKNQPDRFESRSFEITKVDWDMFNAREAAIILKSPNIQMIKLEFDASKMIANVTGAAKSVPANAHVMVANLELGDFTVAPADENGAFVATVNGYPGTHIMVKQDATQKLFNVDDPQATHGPNTLRTIFPPGILLTIPIPHSDVGVSFSSGGRLPNDEDAPWTISGSLAQNQLGLGQEVVVSGQVAILTGQDSPPPPAELHFRSRLLVNTVGRQVGGARAFTTSVLTPTDLPIENMSALDSHYSLGETQLDWRFYDGRWVSDFYTILRIGESAVNGLHQLKASLSGVEGLPRKNVENVLRRSFLQEASLGTLMIGDPVSMSLTSILLADELSEGSRGGVLAQEDQGLFDISHRAGTRHQPVISRLDKYGQPWSYRLEPYVPMLGIVDRGPPAVPSIELDFSASNLTVTVSRPDGQTDVLGPAPLTQYSVKSPRTPWHKTVSEDGGNLGEVPQLQNNEDYFVYRFLSDGNYVIKLDGFITDFSGRVYAIVGTYEVTVANVLDIETSLLPGTPFEVGDTVPVGLRVMPGLPAAIDYTITHVSANGEIVSQTFTGKANQNGWWDGNGEWLTFQQDGEYRIDVEAYHADEEGNLWVGRLRFGSAIATPNAPMILHGRRGPTRVSGIPAAWGFSKDFEGTDADHIQFPYFSGDILWGQENVFLGDSVVILTSIQALDKEHPIIAKAIRQADENPSGVPLQHLIDAGQMPLGMGLKPDTVGNWTQPNNVDLWAYVYASVQRPGIRVREQILGDDIGGAYWRFEDAYHMQSGNGPQGDLPGDFKFMYAAAVIHDPESNEGLYAIYGSGWVLVPGDDPMGVRFMPPFQGAAGGPNGGPLFTVHGLDVDMFFVPLGVRPGAVLEVGEYFRMAGPIMPTLPSYVEYTVTAPNGTTRSFSGRANSVGYYYDHSDDFELEYPGLWTVELKVTHDGMTSAGPVAPPYPTGGPLTPSGSSFNFVVTEPETLVLKIDTDLSRLSPDQWFGNVRTARFEAALPVGWNADKTRVIATMPGIVLVDEYVPTNGTSVMWDLDAQQLNQLAGNFDYEMGIADSIEVTFYAEGSLNGRPTQAAGTIVTHGARVPLELTFVSDTTAKSNFTSTESLTDARDVSGLPLLSSFIVDKTDKFLVDMDVVKGGHPYKGQGSGNPDDGAHVEFDNSGNLWPEGTAVTDYPPIYAVADGYVEAINTYEPVGRGNHKYGIHLAFAQKNGKPVKFHISIEPSMNPGDSSFFKPFILVKEGQHVRKGEILAYMYLEPNSEFPGPHIHFSVQPEGEQQQAPAIFTEEIVRSFHSRWGGSGFDYKNSPAEGGPKMPACMGYKLVSLENPFSPNGSECLK